MVSRYEIRLPGCDAVDPLAIAGGWGRGAPEEAGAEVWRSWALIKRSIVASLSSSEPGWLVGGAGGLVVTVEPEAVTLPGRDIVSRDFVRLFLRAAKELVERTCKLQE